MEKIKEETFNGYLARWPELQKQMNDEINAQMAGVLSDMVRTKKEDLQALIDFAATLRARMKHGLLDDKAAVLLMKIDNHITTVISKILPAQQEQPEKPEGNDEDRARANTLLADMQGAKRVHITRTIESYRVELGTSEGSEETDIPIEGETSPVEETGASNGETSLLEG